MNKQMEKHQQIKEVEVMSQGKEFVHAKALLSEKYRIPKETLKIEGIGPC